MLLKTTIDELNEKDIEALYETRGNTRERNHRYGDRGFMEILLAGSEKLNQEFAKTDVYKID